MVPNRVPIQCLSAVSLGVTQSDRGGREVLNAQTFMCRHVMCDHARCFGRGFPYKAAVTLSGPQRSRRRNVIAQLIRRGKHHGKQAGQPLTGY
jgi:hypothetical protein